MTRFATLAAAALIGLGTFAASTEQSQAGDAGAFIAGTVFGLATGAIVGSHAAPRYHYAPRRHYRSSYNAHVRWCYNRYRSYNHHTNKFLAYSGHYRSCRSPYGY